MLATILLAAGHSKRMKSKIPKILYPIHNKPIIDYILDAVENISEEIYIICSDNTCFKNKKTIHQKEALGTGHAVKVSLPHIPKAYDEILILCGDTPLIKHETLKRICEVNEDIVLGAFKVPDLELPYGRIIFDKNRNVKKIVEYKDATPEEKMHAFAYAGVMKIKRNILDTFLPKLTNNNNSKEYYLTELINLTSAKKVMVEAPCKEFIGINTRVDLAHVERIFQKRWMEKLMKETGVTFLNPDSTSISFDTKIDQDSTIYPNVYIGPNVTIEEDVTILPFSHLEDCLIKKGAKIGPFARIRGKTTISENVDIGNFVEVKETIIGKNSKAKHLSYLGNAELGESVNIGAGTITANYDGKNKHKTFIGHNVFTGSNSVLVAPIKISEHTYIGAGSVITKGTEPYSLTVERSEQKEFKNWVRKAYINIKKKEEK